MILEILAGLAVLVFFYYGINILLIIDDRLENPSLNSSKEKEEDYTGGIVTEAEEGCESVSAPVPDDPKTYTWAYDPVEGEIYQGVWIHKIFCGGHSCPWYMYGYFNENGKEASAEVRDRLVIIAEKDMVNG